MDYCASRRHVSGVSSDAFGGKHFRNRQRARFVIEEAPPHRWFEGLTNAATGVSTDGVSPFKKRTQICWPLIDFNCSLLPTVRFHLNHVA